MTLSMSEVVSVPVNPSSIDRCTQIHQCRCWQSFDISFVSSALRSFKLLFEVQKKYQWLYFLLVFRMTHHSDWNPGSTFFCPNFAEPRLPEPGKFRLYNIVNSWKIPIWITKIAKVFKKGSQLDQWLKWRFSSFVGSTNRDRSITNQVWTIKGSLGPGPPNFGPGPPKDPVTFSSSFGAPQIVTKMFKIFDLTITNDRVPRRTKIITNYEIMELNGPV